MDMNNHSDALAFYQLLEKIIRALTAQERTETVKAKGYLAEMCKMFRLSKGTTQFYEGINEEAAGQGETLIAYDDGSECKPVMSVRVVTKVRAVVICTVYMRDGVEPLSDDERDKIDLVMRTVLTAVSRNRMQLAIERLAFHDEAGYRNMRAYLRALAKMNEMRQLGSKAAMHFNLRHFSLVNQQIGKSAGDVALRSHYNGLSKMIGDGGTVCRLGGDNFVAICDKSQLEAVLDYLTETPVLYDLTSGRRILIAATAGVFSLPDGFVMRAPGQILDKIVAASYAARTGGKEQIVFYSDTLKQNKERSMRVQQRFPEAMRNEEFHVFYQPKIDIRTGRIIGAEALCRWFRNGEIVAPTDFISVLEETNDICKLDFYMLDHVCADIRRWLDEGREVVRVSVNLSRKHMMDIDLLKNIIDVIDKYEVPHEYVEFELTETTTDVEFRDLKRVVAGLQKAGIYTSVDDFGVGYSSLNLLCDIPWNVLKVDRSFLPVDTDDADSMRTIMFRHVVAMARSLGMECIAEGVETERQVRVLLENGCDLAQGFFFDNPLPVGEFETRLGKSDYPVLS
ncbi:MAG: EAL domain-containing protein [Oscillospiraceae bacterium]|nr:EAL domain-containing protein [Oscillospiraceae bacterium]